MAATGNRQTGSDPSDGCLVTCLYFLVWFGVSSCQRIDWHQSTFCLSSSSSVLCLSVSIPYIQHFSSAVAFLFPLYFSLSLTMFSDWSKLTPTPTPSPPSLFAGLARVVPSLHFCFCVLSFLPGRGSWTSLFLMNPCSFPNPHSDFLKWLWQGLKRALGCCKTHSIKKSDEKIRTFFLLVLWFGSPSVLIKYVIKKQNVQGFVIIKRFIIYWKCVLSFVYLNKYLASNISLNKKKWT